ncbi:UPF0158 family protein [Cohnella luojiensis]|uniref:Uncharacterized protein n=1 Tax=Cohnella luojiensis TaxID=652876 RepID=A0A4Y8LVX7_9BACL|nr:UPF0158 family protein [Cohnella luojiensis]TFE24720.1 hypothetical protein E2980_15380 [Cohnella luojiensis]
MPQLMDELIDAYLDNDFEHPYFLDLQTGEVILDMDEIYTGEPSIDWEDEENEDRYVDVPKIDSNEAYYVMMKFAKQTDSDPKMKLFDALEGHKPFRRFKDTLTQLDIWEEWNRFERHYAEEEIKLWMEGVKLNYDELAERYKSKQP